MKVPIKITKAELCDMPDILKLQYAAYQSEAERYNNFSIQPLTQTLEQLAEEYKGCTMLKAVIDGKIAGSVRALEENNTVYIGKLMVFPEYQNRGIGKSLMTAIEAAFPHKRYELFTGAKSEKNIALYEKRGYRRFKEKEEAPGLTFVYMEKFP